ncbi:hypothetical protein DPMN_014765 [Dreissena polymorpha]|uniref:Uncharacterized protein n=1 Tax=Dreissena polymorpha TaxID=45954 RepID=A0A9D4NAA1_DREPO|nr:hypothetical protein DPMN_014765 [Dreissena polymorpha]
MFEVIEVKQEPRLCGDNAHMRQKDETQCNEYGNIAIKDRCERRTNELVGMNPVTDLVAPHVIYRNMDCAFCNDVGDFVFWQSEIVKAFYRYRVEAKVRESGERERERLSRYRE